MKDPLLPNVLAAPLAAPVAIEPVAFNPVVPAPTTSLLQEAYNRLMAPTATGTIAKRPAWAQSRIDQANQASQTQTAGGGEAEKQGGGGSVKYAQGVLPNLGVRPNQGVLPNYGALPNLGVRPNQGVLPNLGVLPNQGVRGLYDPNKR